MFEEIWDSITEFSSYLFSFEWFGDTWEFFTGMFENMGEFSYTGLVFAIIGFGVVFGLRDWMLIPFLEHFTAGAAIFWGAATYIASAIGGYLVGKRFDDT